MGTDGTVRMESCYLAGRQGKSAERRSEGFRPRTRSCPHTCTSPADADKRKVSHAFEGTCGPRAQPQPQCHFSIMCKCAMQAQTFTT